MTSETIQKYKHLTTARLKEKARQYFHIWIRNRDQDLPCINCGRYTTLQAGHYFAAGKYNSLRFNEDNVHGECLQCNYFDSQSHAQKYRPNLIKKIGQERYDKLELIAKTQRSHKDNRIEFIEIIEKYTTLLKIK